MRTIPVTTPNCPKCGSKWTIAIGGGSSPWARFAPGVYSSLNLPLIYRCWPCSHHWREGKPEGVEPELMA